MGISDLKNGAGCNKINHTEIYIFDTGTAILNTLKSGNVFFCLLK